VYLISLVLIGEWSENMSEWRGVFTAGTDKLIPLSYPEKLKTIYLTALIY
jgi:hypothetical protein